MLLVMSMHAADEVQQAARLFHALSDPTRLEIVRRLAAGEHCVCDLQETLDAAQSRLSFHLKVLREAGLVTDRKQGRWSYYSIVPQTLQEIGDLVSGLHPVGHAACCQGGCCG